MRPLTVKFWKRQCTCTIYVWLTLLGMPPVSSVRMLFTLMAAHLPTVVEKVIPEVQIAKFWSTGSGYSMMKKQVH